MLYAEGEASVTSVSTAAKSARSCVASPPPSPIYQTHVKEPHRPGPNCAPAPPAAHHRDRQFSLPSAQGSRAKVMNSSTAPSWSTAEQFAMDQNAHDFTGAEFIDFDNLDLHFNIDGYSHDAQASNGNQLADLTESLNVHHLQAQFPPQLPQDHRDGANGGHQVRNLPAQPMPQSTTDFFDYGMSQYSQAGTPTFSQPQDQIYRPHQGVPPTPNSIEMHGDPTRYLHQLDSHHVLFDQRYHMPKDDAVGSTPNCPSTPQLTCADIYPPSLACSHTPRCPLPDPRLYRPGSLFQPSDVARAECPEPPACPPPVAEHDVGELDGTLTN